MEYLIYQQDDDYLKGDGVVKHHKPKSFTEFDFTALLYHAIIPKNSAEFLNTLEDLKNGILISAGNQLFMIKKQD